MEKDWLKILEEHRKYDKITRHKVEKDTTEDIAEKLKAIIGDMRTPESVLETIDELNEDKFNKLMEKLFKNKRFKQYVRERKIDQLGL